MRNMWLTVGLFVCAAGVQAATASDHVAFTTRDVCSASGAEIVCHVKAVGPKALVEITYRSAESSERKEVKIFDFQQSSITTIYAHKKAYAVHNLAGLTNVPLWHMIRTLRELGADEFKKVDKYKGTIYQAPTVTTHIDAAETDAKHKRSVVDLPPGYSRIDENAGPWNNLNSGQPGSVSGSSRPFGSSGTEPTQGAPVSLPPVGPGQ